MRRELTSDAQGTCRGKSAVRLWARVMVQVAVLAVVAAAVVVGA